MTLITANELSNAQYHATDAISSSDVKMVHSKSLAHWKAKVYKSSTTFDLGTCVHSMCLEDGKDMLRGPETRRGKAWSEMYEAAQIDGKTLLDRSRNRHVDQVPTRFILPTWRGGLRHKNLSGR